MSITNAEDATAIAISYLRKRDHRGRLKPVGSNLVSAKWTVAVDASGGLWAPWIEFVVVDALTGDVVGWNRSPPPA